MKFEDVEVGQTYVFNHQYNPDDINNGTEVTITEKFAEGFFLSDRLYFYCITMTGEDDGLVFAEELSPVQ